MSNIQKNTKKSVGKTMHYLDYAATTPVDRSVFRAMAPYFTKQFGNAGSLHSFGQAAIAAVDTSREMVARAIHRTHRDGFREIIFTSGATEANNLVLRGVVSRAREQGVKKPHILISAIEHESVRETARALERGGASLTVVPVSQDGVVNASVLARALTPETVLVSVMYVNNEIGTVQPIRAIADAIAHHRKKYNGTYPLFHTDAAQAFTYFECDADALGVDCMTLSAHKAYGPKGVGALFVRGGNPSALLSSVTTGGEQEFGMRSGTENVAGIVGLAHAFDCVSARRKQEARRMTALRVWLEDALTNAIPHVVVHGAQGARAPHIMSVACNDRLAEEILIDLSIRGFAVSSGAACSARGVTPSHVLSAIGSADCARSTIRISIGHGTTKTELRAFVRTVKTVLA